MNFISTKFLESHIDSKRLDSWDTKWLIRDILTNIAHTLLAIDIGILSLLVVFRAVSGEINSYVLCAVLCISVLIFVIALNILIWKNFLSEEIIWILKNQ